MSYKPIRADSLALFETLGWVQKEYMDALRLKPSRTCLESVLSIIKSREGVSPNVFTWTAERTLEHEKERSGRIMESYHIFSNPSSSHAVDLKYPAPAKINSLLDEIGVTKTSRMERIIQIYRRCYEDSNELRNAGALVISGLDEMFDFKALDLYADDIRSIDVQKLPALGESEMAIEIAGVSELKLEAISKEYRHNPSELVQSTHHTIKQTLRAMAYIGEATEQSSFRKFALNFVDKRNYEPSMNLYSDLVQ